MLSPKDSLILLDSICAELKFDRKTHNAIKTATGVLEVFIKLHTKSDKEVGGQTKDESKENIKSTKTDI